ncbi:hypothetical protein BEWA_032430 [Theileria equi strain WA]|uniref:GPI ethanolamine phosphate transferase 3 n=1 Tax=Theileria equi strain WA TaxID=1537102 RepID=L0AXX2_THEEQ|nr:hypothetical protein BEWA_032430 [Theileria equi strain WA]AFZ80390.1 hypothetical protein BEWA_032430 [Theileria equi strain WA]|eukprot:XP_004830056.1 hypothetical protein BEWA_032430 [Theileria equi strain WA]
MAIRGSNANAVVLTTTICLVILFNFVSVLMFYLNFEGKNIFMPYYSDRNIVPFPLLFKEFDLSNKDAIRSSVGRGRPRDELCSRRVLPEYDTYRLNGEGVLEHVNSRSFWVSKDMPPGWLSYTAVDKLVLTLLDAYRFDYVIYDTMLDNESEDTRTIFTNHMTFIRDRMEHSEVQLRDRLYKLKCPHPTITVSAVKAILSGDTRSVGAMTDNLNPGKLSLDHIPNQCHCNNLEINLIGDVTSYNLATDCFKTSITNMDANTVNDIYVADNLVYENYKDYLDRSDILLLHLVGMDHLGHCGGRLTKEMTNVMKNYNIFTRDLLDACGKLNNYMLFFFGDHGQRTNGSHGRDSVEEVETFLWIHTDHPLREYKPETCPISETPAGYRVHHSSLNGQVPLNYNVGEETHMNLAATVSLLSNIPVPFHSEGTLISSSVPLIRGKDGNIDQGLSSKFYIQLHHVNLHQLLRNIDALSTKIEPNKYKRQSANVQVMRLQLANLYILVRLLDSLDGEVDTFKDVEAVYNSYANMCKSMSKISGKLINQFTRAFTFHYLYTSILIQYVGLIVLVYCVAFSLGYYQYSKSGVKEVDRSRGYIIDQIKIRLLRNVALSLAISLFLSATFEVDIPIRGHTIHVSWPLDNFITHLAKRYTGSFERMFVIEESTSIFNFSILFTSIMTLLFLYDSPLLFSSIKNFNSCTLFLESSETVKSSPIGVFFHSLGSYNFRHVSLIVYAIIFVMVLVSECALYSHDTISRHLFIICLLAEFVPVLFREGDDELFKTVRRRLLIICVTCKVASFFHDYRLFMYASSLPPEFWIKVETFMGNFEIGALSLAIFYLLSIKVTRYFGTEQKDPFLSHISACTSTFKAKGFLIFSWTMQFLLVLLNFGSKMQHSLSKIDGILHSLYNAYNIKTFTSVLFAWKAIVVSLISSLLLITNPFHLFFKKGSKHRLESILILVIPNWCWLLFLFIGPKRSLHVLFAIICMYHSCALIITNNKRIHLSHSLIINSLADVFYFSSGHIDLLTELPFEAGFILTSTYVWYFSDTGAFFNVSGMYILGSLVLMFTYLSLASLNHDLESNSKKMHVPKKSFKLQSISHIITLCLLLFSALMFVTLVIILKLHQTPCIADLSFPKAYFVFVKNIVNIGTQCIIFMAAAIF